MATSEDVYCTLVLTDSYLPGAAVLAHSLRDTGTSKKLACLIVQDGLRPSTVTELEALYDYVILIDRINNPHPANLYLMNRPDLLYTFSKIHVWRLTQFRKIVYVDSDVVALRAPDELFDLQDSFAAAPDVGWPDAFNTGMMVLTPHMGDFHALRTLAGAGNSFDGADQGLLNQYFEHKPWRRLSFTYNCTPSAHYQYEPAYQYYKRSISMIHFIGREKPWIRGRPSRDLPSSYQELTSKWWAVYDRHFYVSTSDYISTGRRQAIQSRPVDQPQTRSQAQPHAQPQSLAVQEQVNDRARDAPNWSTTGYSSSQDQSATPPQINIVSVDDVVSAQDPTTSASQPDSQEKPSRTDDKRSFSPPRMQWDATRAAPPMTSEPEAVNFPTQMYEFTTDEQPFKPPKIYPEPPKDMWYEVPKEKPQLQQKPKPIFPWEERILPKPTRRFVDDESPLQSPQAETDELDLSNMDEFAVSTDEGPEPITPTFKADGVPWQDFGNNNKNAWDDVSGIDDYVRALTAFHKTRGKVQIVSQQPARSPSTRVDEEAVDIVDGARNRRESLILTDFPTAIERPSLPVTPAPRRRRTTVWGTDEEAETELPPAVGVPDQIDWDPLAQLEQLRKRSLIGPDDLRIPSNKETPHRALPQSSVPIPEETTSLPNRISNAESGEVRENQTEPSIVSHTTREENLIAAASKAADVQTAHVSSTQEPVFATPDFAKLQTGLPTAQLLEQIVSPSEVIEKPSAIDDKNIVASASS